MKNILTKYPCLAKTFICSVLIINYSFFTTAHGFSIGTHIKTHKNYKWNISLINEEMKRKINFTSKNDNEYLNSIGLLNQTKKTHVHILSLKLSYYLSKKLSLFLESGLYNDLKPIAEASFFWGGGGNFELLKIDSVKFVSFAAVRRIKSRQNTTLMTLPEKSYAIFTSDVNYYNAGFQIAIETPTEESNKIIPYLGLEYSILSSNKIKSVEIRGLKQAINGENLQFSANEHYSLVFGLTLVRNKFSTVQFETRYSKSRNRSLLLNIGFIF